MLNIIDLVLWLSAFTSLVFRYCTVFVLSHDPTSVISVLKPICSPLWKLWRRLHSQPVTFTTSNPSDSYLAVVSRSSKSLDKMDLLMINANMMNYWLNSPASCHPHISWGHSYGRFFEQAAINICSGSIPKREFTKPAANRQTDSPKHRTPRYFGVPVPKPASWNPAPRLLLRNPSNLAKLWYLHLQNSIIPKQKWLWKQSYTYIHHVHI